MNRVPHIGMDTSRILKYAAFALWGSVGFVAAVFLLRSFAGALTQELSPLAACLGTTLAAMVSLTAYFCERLVSKRNNSSSFPFWQILVLTILSPMLVGMVLVPVTSSWGIAWVTILVIGMAVTLQLLKQKPANVPMESAGMDETISDSRLIRATPDLSQWMTRRVITEAGETWDQVEGQITVEFAAEQQHATVHLSMCPPLPSTPEIECEVPEDTDLNWKVTAVHPYGVRLEVRRPRTASEPARIALGYTMAARQEPDIAKAA